MLRQCSAGVELDNVSVTLLPLDTILAGVMHL